MKKLLFLIISMMTITSCGNKQSSQGGVETDSLANAEVAETKVSKYAEQEKELQTGFEEAIKNGNEFLSFNGTIGDQKASLIIVNYDIMKFYGSLDLGEPTSFKCIYLKGYQEVNLIYLEGYYSGQKYEFDALYQDDSSLEGTLKIDGKELKVKLSDKETKEDPKISEDIETYEMRVEQERELLVDVPVASTVFIRYSSITDELEGRLEKQKGSMSESQLAKYKAAKKKRSAQIKAKE